MKANEILSSRIREVYLNGKWIANTNVQEQIQGINFSQATHQIDSINSPAALCFHLNYYLKGLLEAFDTGILSIRDQYSFELPPILCEADWISLRKDLLQSAEAFAACVESMDEQKLGEIFIEEKYGTYARNIEALIEHSYYHLGQLVLINKLIKQQLY